jgi:hypothetical protein
MESATLGQLMDKIGDLRATASLWESVLTFLQTEAAGFPAAQLAVVVNKVEAERQAVQDEITRLRGLVYRG